MKQAYCMRFDSYSDVEFLWDLLKPICKSWCESYPDLDDLEFHEVKDRALAARHKHGFSVEFEINDSYKSELELDSLLTLFSFFEDQKLDIVVESINHVERYEGRRFRKSLDDTQKAVFPEEIYSLLIDAIEEKITRYAHAHKKITELLLISKDI